MGGKFGMILLLSGFVAGCSQFPDLDTATSPRAERAEFPQLVPVEGVLAETENPRITPETETQLQSRAARLRARARQLRGAIVDPQTRDRMQTGIDS